MDAEKVRRVLEICMDAYQYMTSPEGLGRDERNKKEALEAFRTDARKYPALIAKEGLFIPLLDMLRDSVEKKRDKPHFVKHKKVYSWVVVRVLYEVIVGDERLSQYARKERITNDNRTFDQLVLNVDGVVEWIIRLAPGGDSIETNFRNEHMAKQLVESLLIVKKFAEAMIPPKETGGGGS